MSTYHMNEGAFDLLDPDVGGARAVCDRWLADLQGGLRLRGAP